MKTIICNLLIGAVLAMACASSAGLLQGAQEEKQVQLLTDDEDDGDDVVEKALLNLIQQKMQHDDDDKLADAQLLGTIIRPQKYDPLFLLHHYQRQK